MNIHLAAKKQKAGLLIDMVTIYIGFCVLYFNGVKKKSEANTMQVWFFYE